MKNKETTSEGFHRIFKKTDYREFDFVSFKIGVEWQQERSYSEEEVLDLLNKREQYLIESVGEFYQSNLEWFEQFKKK